MQSGNGVQRVGEARAVLDVVSIVAPDFSEHLNDEVDKVADHPQVLVTISDPSGGRPVAYAFSWFSYVVTAVVRLSDRRQTLYVDRVTIEGEVGGINPFD